MPVNVCENPIFTKELRILLDQNNTFAFSSKLVYESEGKLIRSLLNVGNVNRSGSSSIINSEYSGYVLEWIDAYITSVLGVVCDCISI